MQTEDMRSTVGSIAARLRHIFGEQRRSIPCRHRVEDQNGPDSESLADIYI
jgi:hypothetical protein